MALDSTRYINIGRGQHFDTQRKVIVEMIGGKLMDVDMDRRKVSRPYPIERRKTPSVHTADYIPLGNGLFFDKKQKVVLKEIGSKVVLYSQDRRKKQREPKKP